MFGKFAFNKKDTADKRKAASLGADQIPKHVAIIMDGNGRWAQRRGLPRIAGHRSAMKTVRRITLEAQRIGVQVLTLYAFSTENWKRPKSEVDFLMRLPEQFLNTYLAELNEKNVQVRSMGDPSAIPDHTMAAVNKAVEQTKNNDGIILNFALNYGSYAEITDAVRQIAREVREDKLDLEAINEQVISERLKTALLPAANPDLLIRTGGELRLSNFMLWQLAYTELYFTEIYWPDFTEADLQEAIRSFSERQRRFGGIKTQEGDQE